MSRVIDMSKVDKGTLDRDEALYLRDRLLLPSDYEIPGEGEELTYAQQLKALSNEEIMERAEAAEVDLDDESLKTSKGKLSRPKVEARLVQLHDDAQNTINPDAGDGDEDDD